MFFGYWCVNFVDFLCLECGGGLCGGGGGVLFVGWYLWCICVNLCDVVWVLFGLC